MNLDKLKQVNELLLELQSESGKYKEILYQVRGITHEIEQRARGGFWSTEYITEKCQNIQYLARGLVLE